ncbi:MAG: hypothetical protein C0500_15365, partial [Sphingobium sp.]|nr:hypothetical protein [Sphingobium sp.]
ELATLLPSTSDPDANVLVVMSRVAQQRGHAREGREFAEAAFAAEPRKPAVILTLVAARMWAGDITGALDLVPALENSAGNTSMGVIARAFRSMVQCSVDGNLTETALTLEALTNSLGESDLHFLGVTLSNLAHVRKAQGRAEECLATSTLAVGRLESTSAGIELVSARLVRAWALAHLGDLGAARAEIALASRTAPEGQEIEVASEAAEVELFYGDPERANRWVEPFRNVGPDTDHGEQVTLAGIHADLLLGRFDEAAAKAKALNHGALRSTPSFEVRRLLVEALMVLIPGRGETYQSAAAARDLATSQGAELWVAVASVIEAGAVGRPLTPLIGRLDGRDPAILSICADTISLNLGGLSESTWNAVQREAARRPERWRPALRRALDRGDEATQFAAAILLDHVGSSEDVAPLRRAARALRSHPGSM